MTVVAAHEEGVASCLPVVDSDIANEIREHFSIVSKYEIMPERLTAHERTGGGVETPNPTVHRHVQIPIRPEAQSSHALHAPSLKIVQVNPRCIESFHSMIVAHIHFSVCRKRDALGEA